MTMRRKGNQLRKIGLYKIFVHFEAIVHELITSIYCLRPPALLKLLQYYCTAIAQ